MSKIKVIKNILGANKVTADKNRKLFKEKGIIAINLMGSPGSGKTSLLEKTFEVGAGGLRFAVIEGDLATSHDAKRIKRFGVPVVQINTHGGCHLDANMVGRALKELPLAHTDVLVIENVGNLVCPADFDLGESERIVVLSVTEGEDKIEKYPFMFKFAGCCILNKIDLLPHCNVSDKRVKKTALKINKDLDFFKISCKTGEGINHWLGWLRAKL